MSYLERISRNIGLLKLEEQQKIRSCKIAILGTGGIGGPLALNLVYSGCQNLVLVDYDKVEITNLNRQPFTVFDIGKYKVDTLGDQLAQIDPTIRIEKYLKIDESNIETVLRDVEIAVLSLDGPAGSILVARTARTMGIPIIESWATPYLFARWFTSDSIDYESCYGLGTQALSISEIEADRDLQKGIYRKFVDFVFSIPGIKDFYTRDAMYFEQFMKGEAPARSFAPYVWGNSMFASHEIIFAGILQKKPKILAPQVIAFDPMNMSIIEYKSG